MVPVEAFFPMMSGPGGLIALGLTLQEEEGPAGFLPLSVSPPLTKVLTFF